jgi:hypothetical protein
MSQLKKIVLSKASITRNQDELGKYFRAIDLKDQLRLPVIKILNDALTAESAEIYGSLSPLEQEQLKSLCTEGYKTDLSSGAQRNAFNVKVAAWVARLENARPGVGEHVAQSGSQVSLNSELLKLKSKGLTTIPLSLWGTDADIKTILGNNLSYVEDINAAGTYALQANVIINSDSPKEEDDQKQEPLLKNCIQEALRVIIDKGINDKVTLLIPVNCNNSHWRLLKIQIDKQALAAVEVWDSFGDDFVEAPFYKKLERIINGITGADPKKKIAIKSTLANIQKNTYSCMDYVVQEIYNSKKITNEMTAAGNSTELRLAVVKQIAKSKNVLGDDFADSLNVSGNKIISTEPAPENDPAELTAEHNAFLKDLSEKKHIQVAFDKIFAQQIEIYQGNCSISENKLQKIAFLHAYSFFKPRMASLSPEATETEANDKNTSSKLTS